MRVNKLLEAIRKDSRVRDVFPEQGNLDPEKTDWWILLKAGWQSDPATHSIHETSLSAAYKALKSITPCYCQDCTSELSNK